MIGKSSDYICVSLSEEIFRAVEIKGSGASLKVVHATARDVRNLKDADLVRTIQSALSGFNLKTAEISAVIPTGLATTKNIEIPSVNVEEIKSIVSLQAGRHTPFSREEIQTGYISIGVYKNNYTKVLLAIANKLLLKEQLNVLEKAGLKVRKVLFAPEGISSFYAKFLQLTSSSPVGLIDLGKQSTDFVISLNGKPITTRTIPIGKSHLLKDGQSSQVRLADELKKTVEAYLSEDIDAAPASYILTQNDECYKNLAAFLQDSLKWQVQNQPYVDGIKVADDVLKKIATEFSEYSFLDLIASSATADAAQINLIPEEVQLQKSIELQGREVFSAAIYGFVILILVAFNFGLQIYFKNSFLNKLKDGYKDTREEVVSLEDRATKAEVIKKFFDSRMISLDILHELYRTIPSEIYLTGITLDEDGNVSIQGISDIGSLVYNLNTTLKESPLFQSADVKEKTAKKDRGKDVHAFEIVLKLKGASDDMPVDGQQGASVNQ